MCIYIYTHIYMFGRDVLYIHPKGEKKLKCTVIFLIFLYFLR